MVDPLTSLAFSVQSNKGVYALLLGSGLSSAAGIPTGWDITLDLIRKTAASFNESCGSDPAGWYRSKYTREADYSELLDALCKTQGDRMNLLSSYFEPTNHDREHGLKSPTSSHKIIARLVRKGFFRVIVTTNFDRLLEPALEAEGISPTVISSSDAARGALPLVHSRCTLVKVNGDYRDTRIRNTAAELQQYEPELDILLDRIFDEYGMIVCGWSATWDKALCDALMRCPNRRFATYWTRRSALSKEAQSIVAQRSAVEIEITSADEFFSSLDTKIDAIERYSEPHPISAKLAVLSLKKFITEDKYRIELRDLIATETDRVIQVLSLLPISGIPLTVAEILERMKIYENTCGSLTALIANGAYWGEVRHQKLWSDSLSRVGGLRQGTSGLVHLLSLRIYPACLLLYAAGLASIAAEKYETLRTLIRDTRVRIDGVQQPILLAALPWDVLDVGIGRQLPGYERRYTPVNDRVFEVLRTALFDFIPDENEYADIFDEFEYITSLVHLDLRSKAKSAFPHAPVGRFGWRRNLQNKSVVQSVSEKAEELGDKWVLVKCGVFESIASFKKIQSVYNQEILPRIAQWY